MVAGTSQDPQHLFSVEATVHKRGHKIFYMFSKSRSATPLFEINELRFFHDPQISTFILLTSLGFVLCSVWHDVHGEMLLPGVHLSSLGTCHPRGPISKVNVRGMASQARVTC